MKNTQGDTHMKMFTTVALATAFLGLAACSNEPAPAPTDTATATTAPADNAAAPAENTLGGGSAKPAEGAPVQAK